MEEGRERERNREGERERAQERGRERAKNREGGGEREREKKRKAWKRTKAKSAPSVSRAQPASATVLLLSVRCSSSDPEHNPPIGLFTRPTNLI